jgi:hypothetical protein
MKKNKSITNDKKLASLVGILPVMMDFMEDLQTIYPVVYSREVKKAGNDFIKAVEKNSDMIYKKMKDEEDKGVEEFYHEIINMGNIFREWLKDL